MKKSNYGRSFGQYRSKKTLHEDNILYGNDNIVQKRQVNPATGYWKEYGQSIARLHFSKHDEMLHKQKELKDNPSKADIKLKELLDNKGVIYQQFKAFQFKNPDQFYIVNCFIPIPNNIPEWLSNPTDWRSRKYYITTVKRVIIVIDTEPNEYLTRLSRDPRVIKVIKLTSNEIDKLNSSKLLKLIGL